MMNPSQQAAADAVRAVLQRLQHGYTTRDAANVQSYVDELFVPDDDLLIVGTGPVEWDFGPENARELLEGDWRYWGDVVFDVPNAHIVVNGDTAIAGVKGTISKSYTAEQRHELYVDGVKDYVADKELTSTAKLHEIIRDVAQGLYDTQYGERYVWPLRLTAVLVQRDGRWLFQHLHFSYPTMRPPDTRIVE